MKPYRVHATVFMTVDTDSEAEAGNVARERLLVGAAAGGGIGHNRETGALSSVSAVEVRITLVTEDRPL